MRKKLTVALLVALAGAAGGGSSGCYYLHLAEGQWRVLRASRDIDAVLADPDTPEPLRHQLALVGETPDFARRLGLSVDDQYTSYLPWPGDRIATSVVATRPGEIEPAGFTFPLVGTVPYKGFFERERAEAEAARLRELGMDVCVLAVPAYSTLGWLADPVTAPMVGRGDAYLVETLIHELVHATVYAPDAARLNDACLSSAGTYWGDLPRYDEALAERGGELRALLEAAARAADADDPRAALLGVRP